MGERVEFRPVVVDGTFRGEGILIRLERFDKETGVKAVGTTVISEMDIQDLINLDDAICEYLAQHDWPE